ncbi:hypothetical protein [Sphingomonas jinjuensis]|nr:hypothetical protein [Sphingomonas jinjuensis]
MRVPALAWLLLTALAARAVTLGNPIVGVDEEFYYTAGRMMAGGAWPYVDVWDRKPLGLFLVYWLPGHWPPPLGIWLYQFLALAAVVATALLIGRIATRAGWHRGALLAGIFYLLWLNLADGQGGQSPVFYNLLMAGAATMILDRGRGWRRAVLAMLLVGLALQIKYAAVFEGMAFGLWLLADEWRRERRIEAVLMLGALLVTAALVPTIAAWLAFLAAGHGDAFVYANFVSITQRRADPIGEAIGNLLTDTLLLAPLLAMAIAVPRHPGDGVERQAALFLRLWLAAAVLGFLTFGSWFNHYTLPVMLPAACCAAGFVAHRRRGRAIGVIVAAVVFVAGQIVLQAERRTRGTPAQFQRTVAAIGKGPGTLYVYNGSTMLYTATGRRPVTAYLFPTHLMLAREAGAVGIDQPAEIDRIFARRPDVVVMQTVEDGEDLAQRERVERHLLAYRADATTLPLGNKRFTLYRAKSSTPPPVAR